MKPEARHALGVWLIALTLGGFAAAIWAVQVRREAPSPAPSAPDSLVAARAG